MSLVRPQLIVVAAIALLCAKWLQAQEVTELSQTLHCAPNSSIFQAAMSPAQIQGYLNFDSPLVFWRFPAADYSRSNLVIAADANWFVMNNHADRAPFTRVALFGQETYSIRGTARSSANFASMYDTAASPAQGTAQSIQLYLRHIPTAGPMFLRVYEQTKAHPRIARVLGIFRPDF